MVERAEFRDVVLVIDDSPETLLMLTDALEQASMTVLVALDGEQGLRVAERTQPDIILLDAIMPGRDGFEICRQLKNCISLRHVPVIFMTGLRDTESIVKGLNAGGVDYVTKPIVIDEMLARIRVHMSNAKSTQSVRTALDAAGRSLMAVNSDGRVLWLTTQAEKTFELAGTLATLGVPNNIRDWVVQCEARLSPQRKPSATMVLAPDVQVQLSYVGKLGTDEYLLRLEPRDFDQLPAHAFRAYKLTVRELEVLSWIVKGKSNRDTAEILGLSTRTVDKHLEQVYAKLSVENRTAATALAFTLAGIMEN